MKILTLMTIWPGRTAANLVCSRPAGLEVGFIVSYAMRRLSKASDTIGEDGDGHTYHMF